MEQEKSEKVKIFFRDNWKNILLMVSFLVIIALIMSTTCARRDLSIIETNLKAKNDTLHTYKLKNGELMYEKQGYILKIDELEENIGITKKEAKELEKKLKSALATIAKLEGQVRVDTVQMHDSIYVTPDSVYHNNFNYNDKWISLDGTSDFKFDPFDVTTRINGITMDVPLKVGTTKDDKWFVTSENPYVSFSSVEGANIDKAKPKRWSVGVQMGLGLVGGVGLVGTQFSGISTSNTGAGWFVGAGGYIGLGVTYKLAEF